MDLHSTADKLNKLNELRVSFERELAAVTFRTPTSKVRAIKRDLADVVTKIALLERRLR